MSAELHRLLEDPRVWRAGRRHRHGPTLSSGYPALDALLPGGGWPAGKLTEIVVSHWGRGELKLFMPLLARLSSSREVHAGGWLAWVSPPLLPYAPALAAAGVDLSRVLLVRGRDDAESLWAAEQALRSGGCRLVLAWAGRVDWHCLRRLQLAAESGRTPLVLFRPPAALATPSPATLRLSLVADTRGACLLQLVKHRGGRSHSLPVATLQGR